MPKVHVLLTKKELDQHRLSGKVVIVVDILFATTSIATALAHGAKEVIPFMNGAEALVHAQGCDPSSYILSGELDADTLPGFGHPTPLALLRENLSGRTLLYCTTNGTVALHRSNNAEHVYAAALINGRAVVERVVRDHGVETVLLVCSGSADNFNLEDFYGAGHFVSLFREAAPQRYEYTDAALVASQFYEHGDAVDALGQSRVGRLMRARNLDEEIRFSARKDCFAVVPKLVDGRLYPA